MPFGLVEAVGVGEDPQAVFGIGALPVGMRGERDEAVHGIGDAPQAGTRGGRVPVDERPLVLVADHEVPRSQVLMGDDVASLGSDEHLPVSVRRRCEVLHGIVEVPDETCQQGQPLRGLQQEEPVGADHIAGNEGQHLPALIVDAKKARGRPETHLVQVRKQCVHRRSRRPGGTADGLADADDAAADVPAGQRLLFIVLHSASLADRPLPITSIRRSPRSRDRGQTTG